MDLLLIVLALYLIGSYKKDFTTLVFSGFGFIFYGLMTINSSALLHPYNFQFGILAVCYGVYVALRSSLDLITFKREVKKDD